MLGEINDSLLDNYEGNIFILKINDKQRGEEKNKKKVGLKKAITTIAREEK